MDWKKYEIRDNNPIDDADKVVILDRNVERIFKNIKHGKYIDVGCYHPFKGSLTAQLYSKNWNGINIDLSKTSIDLFKIARKKDINLNVAVSNFDGETSYYENSPINQQNSLTKINNEQTEIKIKCHTLNSILKQNSVENFDYLNIDVEGSELGAAFGLVQLNSLLNNISPSTSL